MAKLILGTPLAEGDYKLLELNEAPFHEKILLNFRGSRNLSMIEMKPTD